MAGLYIKGSQNTAIGSSALFGAINASASYNTAIGFQSLYSVTTAYGNVATGWQALYSNKVGAHNSATGAEALYTNTADFNTATGSRSLYTNSTGTSNTASGYATLYNNTIGSYNTALGTGALTYNSSGSKNVAIGSNAGANLTSGGNNIVIGAGVLGKPGEANTTRIGNTTQKKTFIGGIYNVAEPVASGIKPVYINSTGQLGTTPPASSARFKEAVKPMEKASEGILSLTPVTFCYKDDTEKTPQFGLIAEQVAKINPDLVVRDEAGQIYTVRYEAVNAMLLNEFLKEHRRVQELETKAQKQETAMAQQEKEFQTSLSQQVKIFESVIARQQKQIDATVAGLHAVRNDIVSAKSTRQFVELNSGLASRGD
ncbi:MAG: hypothetical protein DME32_14375 [Verrucomicrobia bacterium]|nr:MAG: hypothetical protein DME32_14375 [Verrucomicrobiota bacterium]